MCFAHWNCLFFYVEQVDNVENQHIGGEEVIMIYPQKGI